MAFINGIPFSFVLVTQVIGGNNEDTGCSLSETSKYGSWEKIVKRQYERLDLDIGGGSENITQDHLQRNKDK